VGRAVIETGNAPGGNPSEGDTEVGSGMGSD